MSTITEYRRLAIDEVKPYEKNARIGNIEVIKESLLKNGQYRPVVVNQRTGEILAGNHTWKAAKELGWKEIDATFVDVDDQQAARIVAVDNRSNDLAGYNPEALVELLQDLDTLEGSGYEKSDLDQLIAELGHGFGSKDEDAVPEPPEEPITKPGDVIRLGDTHLLVCADTLDSDAWVQHLPNPINLTITSPPYNLGIDKYKPSGMQKENPSWTTRMGGAFNDSLPEQVYQDQQVKLLNKIMELTADDGALFYNHQVRYREKRMLSPLAWLVKTDWRVRQEIIWDRGGGITLNAKMFLPVDQRIYWLQKTTTNTFLDTAEVKAYSTIWPITPKNEIKKSAPFPVELPRRCVLACSHQDDLIFEPYAGTGTVIIAAHQAKRRSFNIELDPAYCDVIVERFEKYTGIEVTR